MATIKTMLRAAGRCPTADHTFRARNSRMVLAELVLCESRGPVSFIKHLFIFGLFQYAKGWVSRPLPTPIRMGGSGRLLLRAFEREGIPRFSRNEAHSQTGSVRPHSHWKARRTTSLADKIISLCKSILLTFLRLKRMTDLIHVHLDRKLQRKSSFPAARSCWMEASSLTPVRSRLVATAEANSTIAERTTTRESRVRREDSDADAEGRRAPTASPITTPPMWAALLMPGMAAPKTKL